jgi:hypothetical protein
MQLLIAAMPIETSTNRIPYADLLIERKRQELLELEDEIMQSRSYVLSSMSNLSLWLDCLREVANAWEFAGQLDASFRLGKGRNDMRIDDPET